LSYQVKNERVVGINNSLHRPSDWGQFCTRALQMHWTLGSFLWKPHAPGKNDIDLICIITMTKCRDILLYLVVK